MLPVVSRELISILVKRKKFRPHSFQLSGQNVGMILLKPPNNLNQAFPEI
jgi:hypothetical protein